MRREELMAAEVIAKEQAMKAKNAQHLHIGGAKKPARSLFSPSSLAVMLIMLAGAATFVAMLMKGVR